MAAYSYFKEDNYNETIRISESFLNLNPSSEYNSYLQYLISLSYYNLIPNIDRGQNNSNLSSLKFRELIAKYPNSKYVEDSREALARIDEHLAASKMSIGKYQIKKQNYIGAIMNFNYVIKYFSNTKQADEANFRLYEIYYKIGMANQANKIKKIIDVEKFSKKSITKK
jgi:outer membrane protein assembly factor BamD